MGKRADAVIITGGVVFVIEYKVGADDYQKHAMDQVLDYALDLKNFHEGSHSRTLVPILVATEAQAPQLEVKVWSDGVMRPILANRATLLPRAYSAEKRKCAACARNDVVDPNRKSSIRRPVAATAKTDKAESLRVHDPTRQTDKEIGTWPPNLGRVVRGRRAASSG
jgi:hypothetical protein